MIVEEAATVELGILRQCIMADSLVPGQAAPSVTLHTECESSLTILLYAVDTNTAWQALLLDNLLLLTTSQCAVWQCR
jgi:hypothetical protein